MEIAAHFEEIKLIVSFVLGYLCYRKIKQQTAISEDSEMSDSESVYQDENINVVENVKD